MHSTPAGPKTIVLPILIAALLLGTSSISAQRPAPDDTPAFEDAQDLNRWITFYYTDPEPERVAPAIRLLSTTGTLDNEAAQSGLIGFFTGVFKANDRKLPVWFAQLDGLDPKHRRLLWKMLRMSGADTAGPILNTARAKADAKDKRYIESLLKSPPLDLMNFPIIEPSMLDALWGRFSATGNTTCVDRVIGVLSWADDEDNERRQLIGRAAKWSLTSNAAQHKPVLETCRKALANAEGDTARLLREVIAEAESGGEKPRGLPR